MLGLIIDRIKNMLLIIKINISPKRIIISKYKKYKYHFYDSNNNNIYIDIIILIACFNISV